MKSRKFTLLLSLVALLTIWVVSGCDGKTSGIVEVVKSEKLVEQGIGQYDAAEYDEAEETFKRAVTEGVEPDGEPLDEAMPRWRMSDQDLEDLIAYLTQIK